MEAWKVFLINDSRQKEKRLAKWQELGFDVKDQQPLERWEDIQDKKHKLAEDKITYQEVEDIEFPGEVDTEGNGVPIVESIYVPDWKTMFFIIITSREKR